MPRIKAHDRIGARRNTELHQELGPPTARSYSCWKLRARRPRILGKGHAEDFRLATLSVSRLLVSSSFPQTDLSHPPFKIFRSIVGEPILPPSLAFCCRTYIRRCFVHYGVRDGGCWRDQADKVFAVAVPQVVSTQTSPRYRLQAREQTSVCTLESGLHMTLGR